MSAAARTALAAAASTVDDVNCTTHYRQTTKHGDAMVRLAQRAPDAAIGHTDTWQVLVILHQDVVAAEKWLDDHLDQLITALAAEMTVTSATPSEVNVAGTTTNGVVVEGDREA